MVKNTLFILFLMLVFYSSFGQETKLKVTFPPAKEIKPSANGNPAYVFNLKDINGEMVSLDSFKGKSYVLLDFWASWCSPCREFTPHLKKLYQQYHSKGLEIISLSWDFKEGPWRDAVIKDNMMDWYNVFLGIHRLSREYSVSSIPFMVLIDKNGIIIGRYMAPGEDGGKRELDKKLKEIFD